MVKEKHWTDAQVRWTAANHNLEDDGDAENDDDCDASADSETSFQPDPTKVFSHRFQLSGDESKYAIDIDIDLKGYEEESDTIYVSTGLTLWRSSQVLSDYMLGPHGILAQAKKNPSLRLLELGAGLGLNGLLARAILASNSDKDEGKSPMVVMTDGDSNALTVLRENVRLNSKYEDNGNVILCVQQLLWGQKYAQKFQIHDNKEPAETLQENPNQVNPAKFDLILASDAIYVQENVRPLLEIVQELLHEKGEFWFSYCCRRQVSVEISDVLDAATKVGLAHTKVAESDDILAYVFRWDK